MKKVTLAIAGGVGLVVLGWVARPALERAWRSERAPVMAARKAIGGTEAEKRLIHDGVLMQELCRTGASFDRFTAQLAQVTADFRLARAEMERDNADQCGRFIVAIERWETCAALWRRNMKGESVVFNEAMTKVVEEIGEGPWKFGDPIPERLEAHWGNGAPAGGLDLRKAVEIALARGAEDFQWALDSESVGTSVR